MSSEPQDLPDLVRDSHELTTLVLSLASAHRCHTDTMENGSCDEIGTHQIGNSRCRWCLKHARELMSPSGWDTYVKEDPTRMALKAAMTIAQRISDADYPRDYLQMNDAGLKMGVAVIINKGDKYLAVHNPKRGGFPEFPGGGVERGETVLAAARREAWEEARVTLVSPRILCVWNDKATYECSFVMARIPPTETPSMGDAGPVGWVTREELEANPHFGPSVTVALNQMLHSPSAQEWWDHL